jgi:hypothetical protein
MISERDLDKAIEECAETANSYTNCEKLATFLTIKHHLYGSGERAITRDEEVVARHGDTRFLAAITGKDGEAMWQVMDELMDALAVANPRLHDAIFRKVSE